MFDLLVAGGGPVGLATALYAHRAGLDVAVAEPRTGPIDKACGEGLMPAAVRALADLGIEPDGVPFRGIRYLDGRRSVEAPFRNGHGLGVRRTALHSAVSRAVAEAGVPVLRDSVDVVVQNADRVQTIGLEARYLVAADGLHSPIRRQLGLDRSTRAPARYGLRRHFDVEPWADLVEVHWARDREAYVTPVGDRLVGVALLTGSRGSFEDQLRAFPALQARLRGTAVGSPRGAGPLRQRSRARVSGRVLLVGDAAGYVDALTGEGIALGLASARALVDCVRTGDVASYERRWVQLSRRYRWLTGGLLWARHHRPLGGAIVPAACRLPRVFSAAVQQLAKG